MFSLQYQTSLHSRTIRAKKLSYEALKENGNKKMALTKLLWVFSGAAALEHKPLRL
jgi:hypothetical protein